MPQNPQKWAAKACELGETVALNPLSRQAKIPSPRRMDHVHPLARMNTFHQDHVPFVDEQVPRLNQISADAEIDKIIAPQKTLGAEFKHERRVDIGVRHPRPRKDQLREMTAIEAAVAALGAFLETCCGFGDFTFQADIASVAVLGAADFRAAHRIRNIGRLKKLGGGVNQGLLPRAELSIPVKDFGPLDGAIRKKPRGMGCAQPKADAKQKNENLPIHQFSPGLPANKSTVCRTSLMPCRMPSRMLRHVIMSEQLDTIRALHGISTEPKLKPA